uniref:Uncharacterized protein n=1 Tax=Tanacetum cinerariifolium TaxID=118510 RepID=A0A6L2M0Z3_TANCI|nr:hypothetical protein [Tanacetum cinerariifolium]
MDLQDDVDYKCSKLDKGKSWENEAKEEPNEERDLLDNIGVRDAKMELILDNMLDKLDDEWVSKTVKDEDDLDRIIDYLELKSYHRFIDVDDEAYKERRCELLGMTYETPPVILIKDVEITRVELMKEMDPRGSVQRET